MIFSNMEALKFIATLCGGGLAGSLLTVGWKSWRSRMQKLECHYLEDDILSKIPQTNAQNEVQQNLHYKKFKIVNTTNIDIAEFKIIFQFDSLARINECYSQSKEGFNRQKIRVNNGNKNEAEAFVKNFNRGDSIEYVFTVANVTDNQYYVTEAKCVGFKIVCKDKRKDTRKIKSEKSNQVLIIRK